MRRTAAAAFALALACGAERHGGTGVVREVRPDLAQIVLAHEEIPGVMPAMTMSFDAAPELLADLAPGDRVRFELSATPERYRVVALEKTGESAEAPDGSSGGLAAALPELDRAAPFALVDPDGRVVSLESLRGKWVILDFVYTSCPGPCPILSGIHVRVQRALPPAVRERVQLVSISLDPARDTPEKLRAYATARGADLTTWSFLTGAPADVDAVLRRYGVGAVPEPNGEIQHVVVSFLIDAEGVIRKRYFGLDHDVEEYLRDLAPLQASR